MTYRPRHRAELSLEQPPSNRKKTLRIIGLLAVASYLIIPRSLIDNEDLSMNQLEFNTDTTVPSQEIESLTSRLFDQDGVTPLEIRCGTLSIEDPFVYPLGMVFPGDTLPPISPEPTHQISNTIFLDDKEVCEPLKSMTKNPSRTTDATALAVLVHEYQHVIGVTDEAAAECRAIQFLPSYLEKMGHSKIGSLTLARSYAREDYELIPNGYHSDECRDEGKLDIDQVGAEVFPVQIP